MGDRQGEHRQRHLFLSVTTQQRFEKSYTRPSSLYTVCNDISSLTQATPTPLVCKSALVCNVNTTAVWNKLHLLLLSVNRLLLSVNTTAVWNKLHLLLLSVNRLLLSVNTTAVWNKLHLLLLSVNRLLLSVNTTAVWNKLHLLLSSVNRLFLSEIQQQFETSFHF